jgi:hypothetical protein
MSLRQPKRFNDLDTEADGLEFGCTSNAITGSAEVSTRQGTVMRPGNNLASLLSCYLGDHPPWPTQCVTCDMPSTLTDHQLLSCCITQVVYRPQRTLCGHFYCYSVTCGHIAWQPSLSCLSSAMKCCPVMAHLDLPPIFPHPIFFSTL